MRKQIFIIFSILFLLILVLFANDFESEQKKYKRVRTAFSEKEETVKQLFKDAALQYPPKEIFIRIFKYERLVEVWARDSKADTFKFVIKYDFCSSSGTLGPKRMQGDYQIPEGFYYIDRFNPVSNFYLSLGINYPNASDRILGVKGNLGGDIFIHGNCITIGCIPITDDLIKELYPIAILSKSNGQQKIPVHIFPFKFNQSKTKDFVYGRKAFQKHIPFWNTLEKGFIYFEEKHRLPDININHKTGSYLVN